MINIGDIVNVLGDYGFVVEITHSHRPRRNPLLNYKVLYFQDCNFGWCSQYELEKVL
jgi:hypothetical protein